jgi:hypothetical protein
LFIVGGVAVGEDVDRVDMDNEYARILGPAETSIVTEAVELLADSSAGPRTPQGNAAAIWNIRLTEQLNNMQMNVEYASLTVLRQLKSREHSVREDCKGEGMKSKEERDSALYSDARWNDLNQRYARFTLTRDRLVALQWALKSQLSVLNR